MNNKNKGRKEGDIEIVTVDEFKEELKEYIRDLSHPKLVRLWNFIVDTSPKTALKAILDEKLDTEQDT